MTRSLKLAEIQIMTNSSSSTIQVGTRLHEDVYMRCHECGKLALQDSFGWACPMCMGVGRGDGLDRQIELDIRRAVTRFVVRERRTLKVHKSYLPYVLALTSEGFISLGKYADGVQEIVPLREGKE